MLVGEVRAMSLEAFERFTKRCDRCGMPVLMVYRDKDDSLILLDPSPFPIGGWVFVAVGKVHPVGTSTKETVRHGCSRYRKHWC
jgi:hypothetical protein